MSVTDEIVEHAVVGDVDATETKARRRARSIVSEVLISVGSPLENRGLHHCLLPGLWNAAVNVLIACLEPRDIVDLFTDRQRGILGNGDNAASPPRVIPEKQMKAYRAHVTDAGQTIIECLMKALDKMEDEGLDDRFPETVLDAVLTVLLKAWGPDHVRRAMTEQSALLIRGVIEPVNFMEPVDLMPPPKPVGASRVEPEPVKEELAPPPAPRRILPGRRIEASVLVQTADSGDAAWAVSLVMFTEQRSEERVVYGKMHDPNARRAWLTALHECFLAICTDAEKSSARIEVADEQMVRAVKADPGTRHSSEDDVWNYVDAAMSSHDITVSFVTNSIRRTGMEKCDRKITFLLSGVEG